uniref:Uncharacterized protein n=1 Tax=Anguilla anguilla TaxID=7936 RepID=A0A0E9WSS8_ANGAN
MWRVRTSYINWSSSPPRAKPIHSTVRCAKQLIICLELAIDIGHIVQNQPPVCEVDHCHSTYHTPACHRWYPRLQDGNIFGSNQLYYFVWHFRI